MTEKQKWILQYIVDTGYGVDILNSDFVDAYIEKFNAKFIITNWGANKCPDLGRQLSKLYKLCYVNRGRVGLINWQIGFPKWVYHYDIEENYRFMFNAKVDVHKIKSWK